MTTLLAITAVTLTLGALLLSAYVVQRLADTIDAIQATSATERATLIDQINRPDIRHAPTPTSTTQKPTEDPSGAFELAGQDVSDLSPSAFMKAFGDSSDA